MQFAHQLSPMFRLVTRLMKRLVASIHPAIMLSTLEAPHDAGVLFAQGAHGTWDRGTEVVRHLRGGVELPVAAAHHAHVHRAGRTIQHRR
jgi:hypothetical protein